MNNKLIYLFITLFVIDLHVIILSLFFQSNPPTWLQHTNKKSSPIRIQLISAEESSPSKPQIKSKLEPIKNTQIHETQVEELPIITTETQDNEFIETEKEKQTQETDEIIEEIIEKIENNENNENNENIDNIERENSKVDNNNLENQMSVNNSNENNNFANHQPININEENENEDENEDNEEMAGFETMYRSQYNQKTININEKNTDKKLMETPVFDDILYISETKAIQNVIEPLPPQLPLEIINSINQNNLQQPWQVIVTLYVDKHGNVLNNPQPFIKPLQSSGNPLVDENALQYVTTLRFQPFIKNDKAVVAEIEFPVRYLLSTP